MPTASEADGANADAYLRRCALQVDRTLEAHFNALIDGGENFPSLIEAMRYAALNGGKRIRAALLFAAAEAVAGDDAYDDASLCAACAVELIHAYSLIHDDLPAMDDDNLRRGKAACHIMFGEGVAILAGDALQVEAFRMLAECDAQAERRLRMSAALANAIGAVGMAGGQALDLEATGRSVDIAQVELIHSTKTACLIEASLLLGALRHGADDSTLAALSNFGRAIGLAFQLRDDLLDLSGDPAALGKRVRADASAGKATYPAVAGAEGTQQRLRTLHDEAQAALDIFGDAAGMLRSLAVHIVERDH